MINIRKLEADLWESADLLRAGSKLTSNQYCMPVLGLIFLRYAYSRFKMVEAEILKNRPVRGGRVMPVEASDFASKSALFLPLEAQYEYLVNLPADIASARLTNQSGHTMNSLGEVVNNAMELVEAQSEQLTGVLPKDYTMFSDELLAELLRIFNNSALNEVGGDVIGREMIARIEAGEAVLYPGTEETLNQLKARGYEMVILSNCKRAYLQAHRKAFRLEQWFTGFYCCEDFDFAPKEEIFTALRPNHPADYAVIGDRASDLQVALTHHLCFVGCAYGFGGTGELAAATRIARSPAEIPGYIAALQRR